LKVNGTTSIIFFKAESDTAPSYLLIRALLGIFHTFTFTI